MESQLNLPPIIGIVGRIRAGKSSAAEYLSNNYGYTYTPNVRVLKSILNALGLPLERKLLATVGDTLFSDLGKDIIAKARVSEISKSSPNGQSRIVVDGIRYIEELNEYRKLRGFMFLAISCSDQTRYERTLESLDGEKDGLITKSKFLKLNHLQSERDVPYLMSHADSVIVNDLSYGDFELAIDLAIKEFLSNSN